MSSTPPWLQGRSAGVLAHVSSLPGAYGIGNLGATAHAFIDLLAESGMRFWQICPVGPTGYGDSPYQSFSSFAGNPYFIDLAELVAAGLLTPEEVQPLEDFPAGRVDYGGLYERFWPLLRRAAERFAAAPGSLPDYGDFDTFCAAEAAWLEAYALFMTLKQTHGGVAWIDWETRARRGPEAIPRDDLTADQRREVAAQKFLQYVFAGQWERLRAHARERGVQIIGDLPIFVAYDSCDVWQDRAFFQLDAEGRPLAVAGVPPDYFSASGQRWGNPLYDWDRLRADGYAWWLRRLERAFNFFDVIRLDHFRGFDTYWSVPSDAADARAGEWKAGPGSDFLDTVQEKLAHARIIAEDLGYITAEVVELRRRAGLPGMKILQFAYGHDENNVNLPHFHAPNAVVYTGTHDNDTARGWLASLHSPYDDAVRDYFGLSSMDDAWPLIRAAYASPARLAIVPLQDLLNLGSEARLNRPGTSEGNWAWRVTAAQLEQVRAQEGARLRHWQQLYDRTGDARQRDYSAPPEADFTRAGADLQAAR